MTARSGAESGWFIVESLFCRVASIAIIQKTFSSKQSQSVTSSILPLIIKDEHYYESFIYANVFITEGKGWHCKVDWWGMDLFLCLVGIGSGVFLDFAGGWRKW